VGDFGLPASATIAISRRRRLTPTGQALEVIPARNEVAMLPRSLESLLAQNYPGKLFIVAVDDESSDGTGQAARMVANNARREVVVLDGEPLPAAWTGKVWTMHKGITHAETIENPPDYLLLTDADIDYASGAVVRLVARAKAAGGS